MPAPIEPPVTLIEDAVADPLVMSQALRPLLTIHPVPQSDPRTRGLMVEISGSGDDMAWLRAELPPLAELMLRLMGDPEAHYLLAVNETPPSDPQSFLLRPHLDRRWQPEGFSASQPLWTNVVFLDFPESGQGGELVVFPADAFNDGAVVPREGARRTVEERQGQFVAPRPGTACRMAGDLPHAVLGYSADSGDAWRLAAVLAEFTRTLHDPPTRRRFHPAIAQ